MITIFEANALLSFIISLHFFISRCTKIGLLWANKSSVKV